MFGFVAGKKKPGNLILMRAQTPNAGCFTTIPGDQKSRARVSPRPAF
jgi:hypothetical protein